MADITLSSAMRSSLLSLKSTQGLFNRTQDRVTTGLKIASPIDDAVKFFQSKALDDRASDLSDRKSQIGQGISTLETALETIGSVEDLLSQMKGVISNVVGATNTERTELHTQITELARQITNLVNDASYQGLNLLNSSSSKLSVRFSEKADSKLDVTGVDFRVPGPGDGLFRDEIGGSVRIDDLDYFVTSAFPYAQNLGQYDSDNAWDMYALEVLTELSITCMENTISNVRSVASGLVTNISILNVRSDFTNQYVDILKTGSDKLVLAETQEEGANLLALQTRQSIGAEALSLAGQSESSILNLFR